MYTVQLHVQCESKKGNPDLISKNENKDHKTNNREW